MEKQVLNKSNPSQISENVFSALQKKITGVTQSDLLYVKEYASNQDLSRYMARISLEKNEILGMTFTFNKHFGEITSVEVHKRVTVIKKRIFRSDLVIPKISSTQVRELKDLRKLIAGKIAYSNLTALGRKIVREA